jgi:hypothetical protein
VECYTAIVVEVVTKKDAMPNWTMISIVDDIRKMMQDNKNKIILVRLPHQKMSSNCLFSGVKSISISTPLLRALVLMHVIWSFGSI